MFLPGSEPKDINGIIMKEVLNKFVSLAVLSILVLLKAMIVALSETAVGTQTLI